MYRPRPSIAVVEGHTESRSESHVHGVFEVDAMLAFIWLIRNRHMVASY